MEKYNHIEKLERAKDEGKISQETYNNTVSWLENDQLAQFQPAIADLIEKEAWQELSDAFYTQIEFGTAGIRGRTGLGSARINSWTVGTAAQGLADYITHSGDPSKGVVIGSDTRLTGPEFVELTTNILVNSGIKVFRFTRPAQVGMLSFAVRHYQTQAGVYISASHNPPTDNGLKIYWEDGAQVLPPHDKAITEAVKEVKKVSSLSGVEGLPQRKSSTGSDNNLLTEIGDDFDALYQKRVLQESVYSGRSAKIVYSPFHGTGQYGVLPILKAAGFEITTVDTQMTPDGNFPNIPGGVPNPQNRESNQLTAKAVLETGADLGISSDPDADRLALVVPENRDPRFRRDDSSAETIILDGNETVALLAYFIASQLKTKGQLPNNGFLVRTAVTTPIIDAIAADFGLKMYNTLPVGFKYIGETIRRKEDQGDEQFVFGGEESFGCLKGSYARDKDASSAALIACELFSWLKDNGRTVWDLFDEIYSRYGYHLNDLVDIKFEGAEGFAKMTSLMHSLRENPPKTIGQWPVMSIIDRQTNEIRDPNGEVMDHVEGRTTNMLVFNLSPDNKTSVKIRPSGTEPKMKLYIALYNREVNIEATKAQAEELKKALTTLAEQSVK